MRIRPRWTTPVSVAICLIVAHPLAAQSTLTGLVRDSSGRPIAGAEVAIEALSRVAHADQTGHYLLNNITPGVRLVRVRRIGFSQFSRMVQIAAGENAMNDVVLSAVVTKLDTVVTRDQMLMREDPLLREFEENRKLGLGHFITRAELAKFEGRKMGDIVSQFQATRVMRQGTNPNRWIAAARGLKSLHSECVKLEGGPQCAGDCFVQVYLDYALLSRFEIPNIDQFNPAQIESIEFYAGGAETPPRYAQLNSQCGVLVLHTRRPP